MINIKRLKKKYIFLLEKSKQSSALEEIKGNTHRMAYHRGRAEILEEILKDFDK